MTSLCCEVLKRLEGKTLVTAESITGGGIGAALTAIAGSSAVYKGGVISYCDWVKEHILNVPSDILQSYGAVSWPVAGYMAGGVRKLLNADYAVSVTGLAGPGGDDFGNAVGTVFIGFDSKESSTVEKYVFSGDRESIRRQTVKTALEIILREVSK